MPGQHYRSGPFHFDAEHRMLYREGELIPLMPKTADLLDALLERRGQVVGKVELMKLVWPDAQVEETGLARNISLLRKALGGEGTESRYIKTIPKRGYRFLAEEAPADVRAVRRAARRLGIVLLILFALDLFVYWQFYRSSRYVAASPGAPRMAVIPFECTGGALCASFFARPFEDLLAAEISRSGHVRLLSPSTVHRYRDNSIPTALMARLLGLQVVLVGSVSALGPQVRVIARLSNVHSGRLVWSESYDLPAGDPAMAQRVAAQAIAGSQRGALSLSGREWRWSFAVCCRPSEGVS